MLVLLVGLRWGFSIFKGFKNHNIAQLEILNIVVALKIWTPCWENKKLRIYCDNLASVEVLTSGKARDQIMATCARNIWLLCSLFNVHSSVHHISGKDDDVADLLSRWTGSQQNLYQLSTFISDPVWMLSHMDLTILNHQI